MAVRARAMGWHGACGGMEGRGLICGWRWGGAEFGRGVGENRVKAGNVARNQEES
ncbi:MAG: hypothetical protein PHC41_03415 [Lachnospiraceae bacterium]|nr:hypothetical protein [Lachnospiraceae bacterium]MDD3615255.1 hypothetical protein [Lachnospiraceae bacterium]